MWLLMLATLQVAAYGPSVSLIAPPSVEKGDARRQAVPPVTCAALVRTTIDDRS